MPQMAPYNWLMLMILFTFIMLFYITNLYYTTPLKIPSNWNKYKTMCMLPQKIKLIW